MSSKNTRLLIKEEVEKEIEARYIRLKRIVQVGGPTFGVLIALVGFFGIPRYLEDTVEKKTEAFGITKLRAEAESHVAAILNLQQDAQTMTETLRKSTSLYTRMKILKV
ncbi:MAG: hypothetical protein WEE20_06980 [Bacteroidota bacterium]